MAITIPEPDVNNVWRLETPGNEGWVRSARPDAADKFFMCSADGHVQEPNTFLYDRIDPSYHHRLPTIAVSKAMDPHGKGAKGGDGGTRRSQHCCHGQVGRWWQRRDRHR